MSESNTTTPTPDEGGGADGMPEDPANLQSAEDLDSDALEHDPMEEGVEELPEDWTVVTASRPTNREEREGETLDEHLAEERPDQDPEGVQPTAELNMEELDESVDERPSPYTGENNAAPGGESPD